MPTFSYQARNPAGQMVTGLYDAADRDLAAQQLRDQGFWITEIRSARPGGGRAGDVWDRILGPAHPRALSLMFRQLGTSVNAGISVSRSVELVSIGTFGRLRRALGDVVRGTAGGATLSSTMAPREALFGPAAVAMIQAGESSGRLAAMLNRCAGYYERVWTTRQRVRSALVYPAIMLLAFMVIPLGPIYFLQGTAAAVRAAVSEVSTTALLIAAYLAIRAAVRFPGPGRVVDEALSAVPIVGGNRRKAATAQFLRTFSDLFDVGISPVRALAVAAETCGNRAVESRLLRAEPALQAGATLSTSLAGTRALPAMALQMLATGELSGDVAASLAKAADFLEGEVEASTETWLRAMPVLLWLVIALPMIGQIVGMWGSYAHTLQSFTNEP